eukprot:492447_1
MNHSINILLWIMYTLFTLLYGQGCQVPGSPDVCSSCLNQITCKNNNPGIDGCGCFWIFSSSDTSPQSGPGECEHITCDPTIDPTVDPTADPTVNPTVNPSETPSNSPSKL